MRFLIEADLASRPSWWLVDDGDRALAWAGTTYVNMAYADQAAHDFRVNSADPDYRVHVKAGSRWWWTAWGAEGVRVAVSSETYPTQQAARDAARTVQQEASTALGP
jgi:hypothetical protein